MLERGPDDDALMPFDKSASFAQSPSRSKSKKSTKWAGGSPAKSSSKYSPSGVKSGIVEQQEELYKDIVDFTDGIEIHRSPELSSLKKRRATNDGGDRNQALEVQTNIQYQ